jgi:mono/diheme cytochrome c family protein
MGNGSDHGNTWARLRVAFATIVAATVAFSLAGCHGGSDQTPQQALGKHLFDTRCEHCHGENDLALNPAPPNVKGVLTGNLLPSGDRASDDAVRRIVLNGKKKMPSFAGRFTEEQMQALLAYLHTDGE